MVGLIETAVEPDALLVVNVAVAPRRQSGGLGRQLLAPQGPWRASRGWRRHGYTPTAAMARNITIYQGLGYRVDREETNDERGTVVHMVKTIDDAGAAAAVPARAAGADPAFSAARATGCRCNGISSISAGRGSATSRQPPR